MLRVRLRNGSKKGGFGPKLLFAVTGVTGNADAAYEKYRKGNF